MNITIEPKDAQSLSEKIASKLVELVKPIIIDVVKNHSVDEELLTREEVAKRILKCSVDTADKYYLYEPSFPVIIVGKNTRRYPKKLVEEWLHKKAKQL